MDTIAKVIEEMRRSVLPLQYELKGWADRLAALDGWRPIAEDPKGLVLLYWPPFGTVRGHGGFTHQAMMRVDYAGSTPNRPPTHWVPLPTPPKETP